MRKRIARILSDHRRDLCSMRTKRRCQGRNRAKKRRSSDGSLVNVGNFDSDGVNVNRNDPRNHNDNLGVAFFRSVRRTGSLQRGCFSFCCSFSALMNPPSCFPIPMSFSERKAYRRSLILFVFTRIRTAILIEASSQSIFSRSKQRLFSDFLSASKRNSIMRKFTSRIFVPSVYRCSLGILAKSLWNSTYTSESACNS